MKSEVISLFPYVGGKSELALHIVEMINETYARFPEIDTYIEPCGGGGRVIMNLPRRGVQIYSEYDPYLCYLFWAASDNERVMTLIEMLEEEMEEESDFFTRDYYDKKHKKYMDFKNNKHWIGNKMQEQEVHNQIRCAADAYYLTHLSYNGRVGSPGFYSLDKDGMRIRNEDENFITEDSFRRSLNKLPDFPDVLEGIEIHCGDVRSFLHKYNEPKYLHYIDSPYLKDSYVINDVLNATGLVRKKDYELIKAILDKGGKPVFVKKDDSNSIIEWKQKRFTPISFASERTIKKAKILWNNGGKPIKFNNENADETPAIFNYYSVAERFKEEIEITKKERNEEGEVINKWIEKPECYDVSLRSDYTSGVNVRLHMDIVTLAKQSEARIMISGYDNSVYDYLLENSSEHPYTWRKIPIAELAVVSSTKAVKEVETEYIWQNF